MRTTPNPMVIDWALNRAGLEPSDIAGLGKHADKWATGDAVPTTKQTQKLAAKTHVPLPYFYGEEVPSMRLQIPDFRTTYTGSAEHPSPELYDTINLMQSRQDWLSSYLEYAESDKVDFVGACAQDKDVRRASALVKNILGLEDGWARGLKSDEAVRRLRDSIESAGVYTCAGGYFHHNSRPYDVNEFRGFVLVDEYAPIIFVNTQDAKSAQLFTLIHEFAHLLFNESGVDDLVYEVLGKEDLCDSVAAEVLVPTGLVFAAFDRLSSTQAIDSLRKATKASEIVCLRRAHELGCITKDEYFRIYAQYKEQFAGLDAPKPSQGGGGPSYYVVQKSMLGKLFAETVYEGVKSESLLYSEAYSLTDMKAANFKKFYAEEGMYL